MQEEGDEQMTERGRLNMLHENAIAEKHAAPSAVSGREVEAARVSKSIAMPALSGQWVLLVPPPMWCLRPEQPSFLIMVRAVAWQPKGVWRRWWYLTLRGP